MRSLAKSGEKEGVFQAEKEVCNSLKIGKGIHKDNEIVLFGIIKSPFAYLIEELNVKLFCMLIGCSNFLHMLVFKNEIRGKEGLRNTDAEK